MGEMQDNGPTAADYADADMHALREQQAKVEQRLADLEAKEARLSNLESADKTASTARERFNMALFEHLTPAHKMALAARLIEEATGYQVLHDGYDDEPHSYLRPLIHERYAESLLRAAHRVARRLDYARRPLMQVAVAEIGRGSADWRAGRFDRAAVRSALGAVLYVLAGGQYAWAERKLWLCGARSDAAGRAAWLAWRQMGAPPTRPGSAPLSSVLARGSYVLNPSQWTLVGRDGISNKSRKVEGK